MSVQRFSKATYLGYVGRVSKAWSVNAVGGVITSAGGYTIHTFTTNGTFQVILGSPFIDYLVVAGGGSATGNAESGGGGAGGYRTGAIVQSAGATQVIVGAGGALGTNNGQNSAFGSIISIGGGFGPGGLTVGANGGSGGGGGGSDGLTNGGLGTAGQGNNGGQGSGDAGQATNGGGGGGGAGQAGANNPRVANPAAAAGGNGLQSSVSGVLTYYAGGGGGTSHSIYGGPAGTHGLGSGPNTGGGGGKTAGDDGIVIVRYVAV